MPDAGVAATLPEVVGTEFVAFDEQRDFRLAAEDEQPLGVGPAGIVAAVAVLRIRGVNRPLSSNVLFVTEFFSPCVASGQSKTCLGRLPVRA